jgi:hypothetical protein
MNITNNVITDAILKEFKERMHLGDHEDDNLQRILFASVLSLKNTCGEYDIAQDEEFKELVFERSRYVYNDALEFFDQNFLSRINSLGMRKALEEISKEKSDSDATI